MVRIKWIISPTYKWDILRVKPTDPSKWVISPTYFYGIYWGEITHLYPNHLILIPTSDIQVCVVCGNFFQRSLAEGAHLSLCPQVAMP